MKKGFIFAIVFAMVSMLAVSCVPLASTNSSVEEKGDNNSIVDEELTDESENDSNVVTDESENDSDELLINEAETDSEINDEIFVDEEKVTDDIVNDELVSDADEILPEIELAFGEPTSAKRDQFISVFFSVISGKSENDICVSYKLAGAYLGIDYAINSMPETCGQNKFVIPKGVSAVPLTFEVLQMLSQDKTLVVTLLPGDGYTFDEENGEIFVSLIAQDVVNDEDVVVDEASDVDNVEINDNPVVDETPDSDSAEEVDEASDTDEISESDNDSVVESEDDVLADVDETPDTDIDVVPTIQNPITSESCKDKVILTELVPGNYIEGWNAGQNNRGFDYFNSTGMTIWYRSIGFCSITSSLPMNAKGEGSTAGKHVENVRCVDHNLVSCVN
ncbi:MAG TPA: hypothetical protein P5230_00790 [Candidatus Magasanikbacteria bacterium]|nr:hypothetical protein [Candidatus Magasanikbacteria bacterium]